MRSGTRDSLAVYAVLAAFLSMLVGVFLAVFTFDLVVEPYPPPDWAATAFTGTVVALEGRPGRKAEWAIVQTDDGKKVRMPRDAHNGQPPLDALVRKQTGRVEFDMRFSSEPDGQWSTIKPEPARSGLFVGVGLWSFWTCVVGGLLALIYVLRRRGRDEPAAIEGPAP